MPTDAPEVQRFWQDYRRATGADGELTDAFAFGDSPEMADELWELIRDGPKRATAGLLLDYEAEDEPIPAPGEHQVILDGRGQPVGIIENRQIDVKPLNQVDAAFAWDEGEGDRSLEYWLDAHHRFFRRRCEALGVDFTDELTVVFVRFALVWPAAEGGNG